MKFPKRQALHAKHVPSSPAWDTLQSFGAIELNRPVGAGDPKLDMVGDIFVVDLLENFFMMKIIGDGGWVINNGKKICKNIPLLLGNRHHSDENTQRNDRK
jgi:hypothetical protein